MVYLFEVYALVAVLVFGLAGVVLLSLMLRSCVEEYAMARERAMKRIASPAPCEPVAISQAVSPADGGDIVRVA